MQKRKIHPRHLFTMIEVLVAVAVLMIMMGFMFQFTAGAQRIWAVSTARSHQSSQSSTFFNCLQKDFERVVYGETEDEFGYYAYIDTANKEIYLLIATDAYADTLKAVRYSYNSTEKTICRQEIDRTHADCKIRETALAAVWFGDFATLAPLDPAAANYGDYVVASDVEELTLTVGATEANGALKLPGFLGVSLQTTVPESMNASNIASDGNVINKLTFSRIFHIDGLQMK